LSTSYSIELYGGIFTDTDPRQAAALWTMSAWSARRSSVWARLNESRPPFPAQRAVRFPYVQFGFRDSVQFPVPVTVMQRVDGSTSLGSSWSPQAFTETPFTSDSPTRYASNRNVSLSLRQNRSEKCDTSSAVRSSQVLVTCSSELGGLGFGSTRTVPATGSVIPIAALSSNW